MSHLTVEEIVRFVSLTELNAEALELAATVNGHIRSCEGCRRLVDAYQAIYDEFSGLNINCDFEGFVEKYVIGTKAAKKELYAVFN